MCSEEQNHINVLIKPDMTFHGLHKVPLESVQFQTNPAPVMFSCWEQTRTELSQTGWFSIVPNPTVPGSIQCLQRGKGDTKPLYKGKARVQHVKRSMPTLPHIVVIVHVLPVVQQFGYWT